MQPERFTIRYQNGSTIAVLPADCVKIRGVGYSTIPTHEEILNFLSQQKKDKMPTHNDGIGLDDSYLFTGLTEAQRMFIEDNEHQILALISELIKHSDAAAVVETHRKEITSIELHHCLTF